MVPFTKAIKCDPPDKATREKLDKLFGDGKPVVPGETINGIRILSVKLKGKRGDF